jgi:Cu/Zn superoxide dismutase
MQSDSRGDTLRRITKAALGGLAGCALALGGTQVAMSAVDYFLYPESLPEGGQVLLEDLGTNTATGVRPFDGASADLRLKTSGTGTNFKLEVSGIAESGVGNEYGAHLHTYDCDEAPPPVNGVNGVNGGPHYNHEVHGVVPGKKFPSPTVPVEDWAEVSATTEAWFTFRPNAHGDATADTSVPFVPVDGDKKMSIVVHLLPTNTELNYPNPGPVGSAGGRQACFPIDASEWALDPRTTP